MEALTFSHKEFAKLLDLLHFALGLSSLTLASQSDSPPPFKEVNPNFIYIFYLLEIRFIYFLFLNLGMFKHASQTLKSLC